MKGEKSEGLPKGRSTPNGQIGSVGLSEGRDSVVINLFSEVSEPRPVVPWAGDGSPTSWEETVLEGRLRNVSGRRSFSVTFFHCCL